MSIAELSDTSEETENRRLIADLGTAAVRERTAVMGMRIGIIVLIILFWEASVRLGLAQELLVGQPSRIAYFLGEGLFGGDLLRHTMVTAQETILGYTFGVALGAGTGLAMWWLPRFGKTIEPYYIAVNAIPMVALAPLFMVWLGLGIETKVALSFSTVYLIMHMTTYASLRETSGELVNLARIFGATKWQIFTKIVIPSSSPSIFSSMKVCIGFALTGAVVGEFVAANEGLGYLTLYAAQLYEMSLVWAAIVALVVISICLFTVASMLQKRFASWGPAQ